MWKHETGTKGHSGIGIFYGDEFGGAQELIKVSSSSNVIRKVMYLKLYEEVQV